MSQEELVALNPSLSEGVKEGMVLKVPAGYIAPAPIITAQIPTEKTAESSINKPVESTGGGIKIIDKVKSTENSNVEVVELTKKEEQMSVKSSFTASF